MSAPVLPSSLNPEDPQAQARAAHNRALAEELRARVAKAALGGDERSRERHVSRGKLLPRERVERLLDPGAPLLEVGQLAANGMYGDEVPGAGIITAIGRVSGRMCMIFANDATVKAGAFFPISLAGGKVTDRNTPVSWILHTDTSKYSFICRYALSSEEFSPISGTCFKIGRAHV